MSYKRIGFKMKLCPGMLEEYRKRHDGLWPELYKLLKDSGISEYSIFFDEETNPDNSPVTTMLEEVFYME